MGWKEEEEAQRAAAEASKKPIPAAASVAEFFPTSPCWRITGGPAHATPPRAPLEKLTYGYEMTPFFVLNSYALMLTLSNDTLSFAFILFPVAMGEFGNELNISFTHIKKRK